MFSYAMFKVAMFDVQYSQCLVTPAHLILTFQSHFCYTLLEFTSC